MENTKREIEVIRMIKSVCQSKSKLLTNAQAVLFGSRTGKQYKERSDFDIGIISREPLNSADFYKLKDALDELPTLYTIDLVDLDRVSKAFRDEALINYTVIYAQV